MTDRRAHSRRVQRADPAKTFRNLRIKLFLDILDHVKFDVFTSMTGKAVNAVAVADRFDCVHHQHNSLFFNIDDAPLLPHVLLRKHDPA